MDNAKITQKIINNYVMIDQFDAMHTYKQFQWMKNEIKKEEKKS